MSIPSIAVITPSLNSAAYLRQTIESVLAQNYPTLEYLVMDGGSTDGTLDILHNFDGEARFRWISAADQGQADAINKGWRQTSGEIIAWLNADDLYLPGTLQRAADFFTVNPNIDILYGDCDYIDAGGEVMGLYPAQPYDYTRLVIDAVDYIPQPASFMRRKVLDSIGELDITLDYVMDFDLWLRAGLAHPAVYLPERLAQVRLHAEAKSIADLGSFPDELWRMIQRYYTLPGIPQSIQAARRATLSNYACRAADCAFWAEDLLKAQRYARESWRQSPLRLRRLWLYLLLGKWGRKIAGQRMLSATGQENPYLGPGKL